MSEFDHLDSILGESDSTDSTDSIKKYTLIGPPKVLVIAAAALSMFAFIATVVIGDSVFAFGLAVFSCMTTLTSRAQNQSRMNQPSYSSTRWFEKATTFLYCAGSLIALMQVLMVAYVAGL